MNIQELLQEIRGEVRTERVRPRSRQKRTRFRASGVSMRLTATIHGDVWVSLGEAARGVVEVGGILAHETAYSVRPRKADLLAYRECGR